MSQREADSGLDLEALIGDVRQAAFEEGMLDASPYPSDRKLAAASERTRKAADVLRTALTRAERREEAVPVAPKELWFGDRWGELSRWSPSPNGIGFSDADDVPESFHEDPPKGWSVFDGTVGLLTAEDIADEEHPVHSCGVPCQEGDEFWTGSLRPATTAEVCTFFGYLSPPAAAEGTTTVEGGWSLRRAVEMAASWFREYEAIHRNKGADAKADRNRDRAEFMESALRSSRLADRLDASLVYDELTRAMAEPGPGVTVSMEAAVALATIIEDRAALTTTSPEGGQ